MSWRRNLRPASFRGVRFEVLGDGERGGLRGAHHVYPMRDQGWVQQLGLEDDRITLDAFVIGDDFAERREALKAALKEPGNGELIDPWLGPRQVVVDPNAGWSISHTVRRGRMTRFSLSFLVAPAEATGPETGVDGRAATDAAADALEGTLADTIAERLNLDGLDGLIADASATMGTVFTEIDAARALAQRIANIPGTVVSTLLQPVTEVRQFALDVIGIGDAFTGIGALLDGVALGIGGRTRTTDAASAPGARPAARLPTPSLAEPSGTVRAATAALDRVTTSAAASPRIAENRAAIGTAFDLSLVSELARASVRKRYAAHGEAIEAMRDLEVRIERELRREADRVAPDDILIRRLTDLRASARDAILASAGNLAPVATVSTGESLPVLAAAWRIDCAIDGEADLIARNAVVHPLWAPVELDVIREGSDA